MVRYVRKNGSQKNQGLRVARRGGPFLFQSPCRGSVRLASLPNVLAVPVPGERLRVGRGDNEALTATLSQDALLDSIGNRVTFD
jgi:hypothetical protein